MPPTPTTGETAPMIDTTTRRPRRFAGARSGLLAAAGVTAALATAAVLQGAPQATMQATVQAPVKATQVAQAGFVPASLPSQLAPVMEPLVDRVAEQVAEAVDVVPAARLDRLAGLAPDLDREVLRLALAARDGVRERGLAPRSELLTVIDYSKPSSEKRLWVLDLEREELLFHELVAHGKNTGDNLARSFSNRNESKQTSLGVFVTGDTYHGGNGYSLRLEGLEPGVNDLARPRAIVMHGAPYVSEQFAAQHGRIGRSWGCPAVSQQVAREMIDTLKGGSVIFSYYPDERWLGGSSFLATTRAAR
jgi:hypothetical protein